MLSFKATLELELDGQPVAGFPFTRRIVATEAQGFDYEKVTGGGYVAVPTGEIASLVGALLRSDQPITVRINGQTDAGLVLTADGFILIVGATINAGATTNLTVNNASGNTARIQGIAIGN